MLTEHIEYLSNAPATRDLSWLSSKPLLTIKYVKPQRSFACAPAPSITCVGWVSVPNIASMEVASSTTYRIWSTGPRTTAGLCGGELVTGVWPTYQSSHK